MCFEIQNRPIQITCDVPPDDSYATVDANAVVLFGDRLTYTCLSGHVLSNPERGGFSTDTVNSITCNLNTAQNNGRYTPRPTVCVSKPSAASLVAACPVYCRAGHQLLSHFSRVTPTREAGM